ncbi:hypothetical protein OS493_025120 [Desmophyllum pertusum]|uniref:Ankyrin repeat domain-containing protein n=1 Tax=Desmophyllum pertusum TaxID=174260 RepID=A0A9W9ZYW4_9CNID|nr:hypothetical protein OS493_025120 [Desmophyllum pertusum]
MSASEQFILAIQTGDLLYVEKHLKRPGTEINAEVRHGRNALHYAADAGKLPIIRFLVQSMAAIIDYQDDDGMTPLMAAVDKDHLNAVDFLLKEGADPFIKDETDKTVFDIARDKEFTKIQKLLEDYKKK